MFINKSEGNFFFFSFSIIVVKTCSKTCSYRLKVSRNIEIGYLFHFKAHFHVLNTIHTSCLNGFLQRHLISFPGL